MAVYNQALLSPDPLYLQPKSYDARADRKWFADIISPGVLNAGDFAVTVPGSPTTLALNWAAGVAYILGGNVAEQGMYRQFVAAGSTVTAPAAHATLPRIDTIILRVMDTTLDASGFSEARIECVPGTATTGATLANLTGKDPLTSLGEASKSFIVLAYVLVPAAATAFTNTATNIKDARTRSSVGAGVSSSSGFPIGGTLEWNSSTTLPDTGTWVVEDGSAISRTTYAVCFAKMGTGAGVGDGSTTFNIADSRGRVAVAYVPSGGHTDHSTMFGNDGVALASRRVRHKHTIALGFTDPTHFHGIGIGTLGATSGSGGSNVDNLHSMSTNSASTGITFSPTVGPQTGSEPTDMIPYVNKNKILRVA